ncbi:FAD-dependent monooxygenase [Stappia sp. ICDLI1TA098]|jgi:salicylate hydroxylase
MATSETGSGPLYVAGAGIGGLTTALALSRRAIPVTVLERAERLDPVGSGLQIPPNAMHIYRAFGLEEVLKRHAVAPEAIRIMSARTGRALADVPLGRTVEERYGAPYLVIHRADLQSILLDAARLSAGVTLTLGASLRDATQDASRVTIALEESDRGDLQTGCGLIGADGVWSQVRRRVMGIRQAVYSGRTAYRAVFPIDSVPGDWRHVTGLWIGRNAHIVHYPVRAGTQLNVVAIVSEDWQQETWSGPAARDELLGHFRDWPAEVRALLERPESWLKWALCGMDPGSSWVDGRLALLGDAAHGMLPFAAQGAAMAVEDAAVLAREVERHDTIPAAFSAYQDARQNRAERVLRLARENDRIYHMSGPLALARDTVMRTLPAIRLLGRLDWLYGWQPPAEA